MSASFRVFTRRWWRDALSGGLEPNSGGRKTTLTYCDTEAEARRVCGEYNVSHSPGRYSVKAEYMRD